MYSLASLTSPCFNSFILKFSSKKATSSILKYLSLDVAWSDKHSILSYSYTRSITLISIFVHGNIISSAEISFPLNKL